MLNGGWWWLSVAARCPSLCLFLGLSKVRYPRPSLEPHHRHSTLWILLRENWLLIMDIGIIFANLVLLTVQIKSVNMSAMPTPDQNETRSTGMRSAKMQEKVLIFDALRLQNILYSLYPLYLKSPRKLCVVDNIKKPPRCLVSSCVVNLAMVSHEPVTSDGENLPGPWFWWCSLLECSGQDPFPSSGRPYYPYRSELDYYAVSMSSLPLFVGRQLTRGVW